MSSYRRTTVIDQAIARFVEDFAAMIQEQVQKAVKRVLSERGLTSVPARGSRRKAASEAAAPGGRGARRARAGSEANDAASHSTETPAPASAQASPGKPGRKQRGKSAVPKRRAEQLSLF